MSIRPVDVNGMIQRTQDIGQLKQHEDNKPVIQQHSIEIQQERKEEQLTKRVNDPEQKENEGYRFDAKEKGNNSYERNHNKKKKKESADEKSENGKVILKGQGSSFDMKI